MRGRGLDQGHVADAGAAREAAFDQVVAEHLAFGQAAGQHGVQCRHVQQALAGEAAFVEDVLINLRGHRVVGVAAIGAGKQPVEGGGLIGACRIHRPGRHDAGLQDAVAGHHALPLHGSVRPQARLVQRVRRQAHQFAQGTGRQHGVGIQRDDVGRAFARLRAGAQVHEGPFGPPGQQRDKLLQLAALAFPADPALFTGRPLALAMQQQEAPGRIRAARMAGFQRFDRRAGFREQRQVLIGLLRGGVGKVGEQGKLRVRLAVGEVVTFQATGQRLDGGAAGDQRRQYHQYRVFGRNARRQFQPRQAAGGHGFADQAVDGSDYGFAGRPQRQQGAQQPQRRDQLPPIGDGRGPGHEGRAQGEGAQAQADQQHRHGRAAQACAVQPGAQAQCGVQGGAAFSQHPVAQRR